MNDMHGDNWYRLLFDHIQDAITVIKAGKVIFANKPALKITGYSFEEYVALTVWQLVVPEEHERIQQVVDELQQSADMPRHLTFCVQTRDGGRRLLESSITLVAGNNGDDSTWLISCAGPPLSQNDETITGNRLNALVQADEVTGLSGIANSHEKINKIQMFLSGEGSLLRGVLDGTPDMIYIKDCHGRFALVNQSMADFYNTSIEEMIGKTEIEYHPVNVRHSSIFSDEERQVMEHWREHVTPEVLYVDAHGKSAWYKIIKRPIQGHNGDGNYLLGVMVDISDRKRLEEALAREQKLYEGGPVVVFRRFSDEPRSVEYVSPNISQYGYSVEDFTSGRYVIADIVHPEDWTEAASKARQCRESGKVYYEMEYRIVCADGSIRWVYDYTYLTRTASGEILYYDWYILDITESKCVAEQNQRQLRRLAALRDIDISITSNMDLRKTLHVLLNQVAEQLNVDATSVLLYDKNSQTLSYTMNRGFRTSALRNTCLGLGEGNAGQAALQRRIIHISDLTGEPNSLEHATFLAKEGFVSYVGVPLIAKNQLKGVLEVFHRSRLEPEQDWTDFLNALAGQAAIAIDDAALVKEIQEANINITLAYDATIEGWARALELRDMETEGHSQRVTDMTLVLSVAMGMKGDDLVHIRRGALLHDIGKMGISDSILLKPGPLSEVEKKLIRRHPIFGYEMLRPIDFLKPAIDIVLYHHEKWDGTGYPRGLAGKQIPLYARLFAIVDVWDAVSHDRPYHKAWKKDQVFDYLQEQSGIHFEPEIADTFLEILKNQKGL